MFGKLGEAQKKAEEIKNRLAAITVEGEANNGKVKVTVDGNRKIKQIHIDASLFQPEKKEEVEDLLLIAIEKAMEQAENVSQSEMQSLMSSMLPGLGSILGK